MKDEVNSATGFLAGLIANRVTSSLAERFKTKLNGRMTDKYRDHWHPHNPHRGSAYRSVTVHYNHIDPLIFESLKEACGGCDRKAQIVGKHFPQELTLWVDPMEVSYRIGDNGSIGVIYAGPSTSVTSESDSETDMSTSSSASSSPCHSPVGSPPRLASLEYLQPQDHSISHQCRQQAFAQSYHHNGLMVYS